MVAGRARGWGQVRCPAPAAASAARKVAPPRSPSGTRSFTCWPEAGAWAEEAARAATRAREARDSEQDTPGRAGSRPGPPLWPHAAPTRGEAAPAVTAVTWTSIKCFNPCDSDPLPLAKSQEKGNTTLGKCIVPAN